jgi:hypothetical protein
MYLLPVIWCSFYGEKTSDKKGIQAQKYGKGMDDYGMAKLYNLP